MITQEQALNTLIQAIQVATKRGAFELVETKLILEAVESFTKQPTEHTSEHPSQSPTKPQEETLSEDKGNTKE